MKVSEVRVGNYLMNFLGEPFQVNQYTIYNWNKPNEFPEPKPIEIDDYWLKKAGWIWNNEIGVFDKYHDSEFMLSLQYNHSSRSYSMLNRPLNSRITDRIYYVHQLQNLVFSITGKEINFNRRLAVVGSRSFGDYELMEFNIKKLGAIDEILTGDAYGADELARRYASMNNIPMTVFPADWKKYGKSAGPIRNKQIITECDEVMAFWDGTSPGTKNSIDIARSQGKEPYIVLFNKL